MCFAFEQKTYYEVDWREKNCFDFRINRIFKEKE